MGRSIPLAAGWLLVACPGTTPTDDTGDSATYECPTNEDAAAIIDAACCTGELSLTIGNGNEPFEPRAEGSCHTMVHGPQGGWHMEVSAQVCGTYDRVYLHYEIYDVETQMRISDNTYKVALAPELDGCCGTFTGMFGYLDMSGLQSGSANTPPELVCLNELELRLEVWDQAGQVVQATRRVIGAPHVDDLSICDPGECPVDDLDSEDSGDTADPETQ